jgi:RND family efflux transporter MFP subunit
MFAFGTLILPLWTDQTGVQSTTTRARWTRAAALLTSALALHACGGSTPADGKAGAAANSQPRQVRVIAAMEDRLARTVSVTGTLAAEEQVTISMKVAGRLGELTVDLGSRVGKGQAVARLVPTDFTLHVGQAEASLQQARARLGLSPDGKDDRIDPEKTPGVRQARAVLDQAQLNKQRVETFVTRKIAPRADLDNADASLKVADGRYQDALQDVSDRQAVLLQRRSEVEMARQQLEDSVLTSPLDGMVRERQATIGQYLAIGSPVATIVKMHPLRLRLAVPERDALMVRVQQPVRVRVEGDPQTHEGRVARVSPAIDETNRTLMVEAEVPNAQSQLRPGSFANAEIVVQPQEKAIVIPASAIVTFAGVDKVLVVQDGKSVEKRVSTGRRERNRIEIVSGLDRGEQVVVDPGNLTGGERVSVVDAANLTTRDGAAVGPREPAPPIAR